MCVCLYLYPYVCTSTVYMWLWFECILLFAVSTYWSCGLKNKKSSAASKHKVNNHIHTHTYAHAVWIHEKKRKWWIQRTSIYSSKSVISIKISPMDSVRVRRTSTYIYLPGQSNDVVIVRVGVIVVGFGFFFFFFSLKDFASIPNMTNIMGIIMPRQTYMCG